LVWVFGGRDPVADHGRGGGTSGCVREGERHGVFVAVAPQAPVGDAGDPAKAEFNVIASGWCLAPAPFAIAVGADG
jgi:hypothetical protein